MRRDWSRARDCRHDRLTYRSDRDEAGVGLSGQVLAIDLGSSGVKVAVVDDEGRVLGSGGEGLPTLLLPHGGAEQDPEFWWAATGRCARHAMAESGLAPGAIEAVVVTAQYMSIVAIDKRGHPVMNTIMWMDKRGRRYHNHLETNEARALWLDRHGLAPMGNDDIAHILYIRNERPEVDARTAAYVEPVDYLNARLTGRITATQTTAFPLLSVDNRVHGTLEYSHELLDHSGLDPAKLPPLVPYDEIIGPLTADAAEHLGVTTRAIVPTGTIDSITSAVGTGALDNTACSIIVGTTSVMVTHVDHKASDLQHGVISVPSPLPGMYFVMAENGMGGKALEFLLRNIVFAEDALGDGPMPADAYERAEMAAAGVETGSNGVMFLPWLVGSWAPAHDEHVRGGFVNLALTSTRSHLVRAVLEGVALNFQWLFGHVANFAGTKWDGVSFGGGGATSSLWGGIMADALGVRVHQLAEPRTTNARGAAFLALERLGHIKLDDIPALLRVAKVHEPDASRVAEYARLGDRFREFHESTRPFYAALNSHPT